MDRPQLTPGPDHPITIEPADVRVVVSTGEQVIASTPKALVLRESTYPPVYYVPLADVDQTLLEPSTTQTYCPYKGDASYYNAAGIADAVWTYTTPYQAVSEIAGYVAFYPDRVRITTESID